MKQTVLKIKRNLIGGSKMGFFLSILILGTTFSCEQFELPEEGSIADLTPPSADFSVAVSDSDYLAYSFTNISKSATDYAWDFGDGKTSTNLNGSNIYAGEGTYTVTLTASDKLGVMSTTSKTIEVVKPPVPAFLLPNISEAGFEDGSDIADCGTAADGRDCWRISGGKIFGITSSPVRTGAQAAKFDAGDPRVAYQALTVSRNVDYVVTIWYTMKTAPVGGSVRLAILGKAISSASEAEAAIIASTTGTDQVNANAYVEMRLEFNSGNSDTIAIWIDSNNLAEARVDDVSIAFKE